MNGTLFSLSHFRQGHIFVDDDVDGDVIDDDDDDDVSDDHSRKLSFKQLIRL